jgi:hypothetical protein
MRTPTLKTCGKNAAAVDFTGSFIYHVAPIGSMHKH